MIELEGQRTYFFRRENWKLRLIKDGFIMVPVKKVKHAPAK